MPVTNMNIHSTPDELHVPEQYLKLVACLEIDKNKTFYLDLQNSMTYRCNPKVCGSMVIGCYWRILCTHQTTWSL